MTSEIRKLKQNMLQNYYLGNHSKQNFLLVIKFFYQRFSVKKSVPRNFAKFRGKYLCQSIFFYKVDKKETLAQVFSGEFCEISKNTFFTEHFLTIVSEISCINLKETRNLYFCVTPKNHRLMFVSRKH